MYWSVKIHPIHNYGKSLRNVDVWWHWHLIRHMGTGHLLLLAALWFRPPGCRWPFCLMSKSISITSFFFNFRNLNLFSLPFLLLSTTLYIPFVESHVWPIKLLITSALLRFLSQLTKVSLNKTTGACDGPKRSLVRLLIFFLYSALTKEESFPPVQTFPFLPSCSLNALSPLHHWPSEPHVRPERGLCDLQLCLLSTRTSVRTAGRTREGQTVERLECSTSKPQKAAHCMWKMQLHPSLKNMHKHKHVLAGVISHTHTLWTKIHCALKKAFSVSWVFTGYSM